ncbi:hypothetical protein E4U31_005036, partial [Claviceps sp. LM219 group G6]
MKSDTEAELDVASAIDVETELSEAAVDAADMLDCVLSELELIAAAVLEAGFTVDTEDTAEDAAKVATEVAPEAAEILACVLSASFELGDPMKLIGAVADDTDSVIDAEGAVEASGVLTRVGNLSFKLVGYAVPEERETELAEAAVDGAGMLDCVLGKLALETAAVLEAGLAVDGADAADDAAEDAAKTTAEVATEIAAEVAPEVAAEVTVEASGGNLSFKLVGYAAPEERETGLAKAAVDAAGRLDCVLGKLALETAAMLEAEFAVDGEDAAEDAAEVVAEVAVEAGSVSAVGAEAAVEVSDVLARVWNFSFKLVGYAVPEERETELAKAAVDAAGMLDCVLDKLALTTAAVLEAGFAVDGEDAAGDVAEDATE